MPVTRTARDFAGVVVLAAVYFGAAKFGLALAEVHPSSSAVWPPSGIALAAILVLGARVWPGVFLGAFLANVTTAGTWATSIGIATGNTFEALVGAWLVRRFARGVHAFEGAIDVFRFAALAALVSTSISATFGVTSLALGGFAAWANYGPIWMTWWLGDAGGDLIVAPALVLWAAVPLPTLTRGRLLESLAVALALAAVVAVVFTEAILPGSRNGSLAFLCIPPLIWAAFRLGPHEASAALVVLAAVAVGCTRIGIGPFVGRTPNDSLLLVQCFMGVIGVMTLAVGGVVAERQRAREALRAARDNLELRVRERTEELTRANEALKQSEERWRSLVQHAPVFIGSLDREGRILSVNRTLPGVSREQVIGSRVYDWIPAERHEQERTRIESVFRTGQPEEHEIEGVGKGGARSWYRSMFVPVEREGTVSEVIFISSDVTETREAQRRIIDLNADLKRRAEQLEAAYQELETFSYSVSHDLRAPLRAIDGFSLILQEEGGDRLDPESRRLLGVVRKNTSQMGRLIDDLLSFARVSRKEIESGAVDMDTLARTALEGVRQSEPTRTIDLAIASLEPTRGDAAMLREVWSNLLSNAWKFTRKQSQPRVEIGCTRDDGRVVYYVKDNGVGFDMQYAAKLFGVFQRLHDSEEFEGTGVGLAIVHRIITRHGGKVWAEAAVDRGATFFFSITG